LPAIRRHRITEVFLVKMLKFGWDEVHDFPTDSKQVSTIALKSASTKPLDGHSAARTASRSRRRMGICRFFRIQPGRNEGWRALPIEPGAHPRARVLRTTWGAGSIPGHQTSRAGLPRRPAMGRWVSASGRQGDRTGP
jgi:hypothetical protein